MFFLFFLMTELCHLGMEILFIAAAFCCEFITTGLDCVVVEDI